MRTLLLALALSFPMLADPGIKMYFVYHTNSPACIPAAGLTFGCLPKEFRQAGIMAFAKSDDASITAYRFTATVTLKDGTTLTRTTTVERIAGESYSGNVIWLTSEIGEFSSPKVSVVALRDTELTSTGNTPGIEY